MDKILYHLTLKYDENLVKKAVLFFWWKVTGWLFFTAMLITIISFIFLVWSGNFSWFTGAIGSVLFFSTLIFVTLFLSHYLNGMKKLKNMGNPVAQFMLRENDFTISSNAGSSTFPWSSIMTIWKAEAFWLIFFAKNNFFTVPLENISKDVQDFIASKINQPK